MEAFRRLFGAAVRSCVQIVHKCDPLTYRPRMEPCPRVEPQARTRGDTSRQLDLCARRLSDQLPHEPSQLSPLVGCQRPFITQYPTDDKLQEVVQHFIP